MAEGTIRIGIIGAGDNTRVMHIPGFQAIAGVEVAGVCNRSKASSEKVAAQFGIARVYEDWKELIAAEDIDVILIGTWPYKHCEFTLAALAEEKHVLCEARMAMNSQEAAEMEVVSKMHPELVTQIVPAPHTLPYDLTISDWVNGEMGDLLFLDMRITTGNFPDFGSNMHWRNNRDLSGNNIMHMGIWYEAAMRWLGTASSVNSTSQVVVKRMDSKEVTIPDHLEVIGSMSVGGKYHLTHSTVLGGGPVADVWIFGTNGTLHFYDNQTSHEVSSDNSFSMALVVTNRKAEGKWQELKIEQQKVGSWRVEEEFINAIRGKEKVTHTSFQDGVKYMEFSDAIRESWETGSEIKLPLR